MIIFILAMKLPICLTCDQLVINQIEITVGGQHICKIENNSDLNQAPL